VDGYVYMWTVVRVWVGFKVFNTNFNNISAISWRSDLLMEETGENHDVSVS
jgi:hypothetical protein